MNKEEQEQTETLDNDDLDVCVLCQKLGQAKRKFIEGAYICSDCDKNNTQGVKEYIESRKMTTILSKKKFV